MNLLRFGHQSLMVKESVAHKISTNKDMETKLGIVEAKVS